MSGTSLSRSGLVFGLMCLVPFTALGDGPRTGQFITHFSQSTPLAGTDEIGSRMLDRTTYEEIRGQGAPSNGQAIDPSKESWVVYVPEDYDGTRPYGVMVYVSPEDNGSLPDGWKSRLKEHRLIYVAANRSGNDQGVLDRRVPLALTGLTNILAGYNIDSTRVYIAGFSGGGVTASRAAAAYADVFTGGLFIATSEGVGTNYVPVPPLDRYRRMQEHGRYVFMVGTDDPVNDAMTNRSISAYLDLCILRVKKLSMLNRGHTEGEPRYLAAALDYLDLPPEVPGGQLLDCEQRLESRLAAAVDGVQQALGAGDLGKARSLLLALRAAFGPLAEPEYTRYSGCLNGNTLSADCLAKPVGGG